MHSGLRRFLLAAALAGALAGLSTAEVTMEWVSVENVNNAADPATGHRFGSVGYPYRIGKYEVTNAQYAAFLNAVDADGTDPHSLYTTSMANSYGGIEFHADSSRGEKYSVIAGRENKPVVYATWFDAARMANWMHNGQGNGSTETGAYDLNGASTELIPREPDATIWIPSENEWYKAAYHDPRRDAGGGDHYWLYPTGSNDEPSNDFINPDPGNHGTFSLRGHTTDFAPFTTDVGEHENSSSYYGTFDQGGNVWEWTDGITNDFGGPQRALRGGAWDLNPSWMESSERGGAPPNFERHNFGIRLAAAPEPEEVVMPVVSVDSVVGTTVSCTLTGAANRTFAIMSSEDLGSGFTKTETTDPVVVTTDGSGQAGFTLGKGGRPRLFLRAVQQP